jgi:hypothetical protein
MSGHQSLLFADMKSPIAMVGRQIILALGEICSFNRTTPRKHDLMLGTV